MKKKAQKVETLEVVCLLGIILSNGVIADINEVKTVAVGQQVLLACDTLSSKPVNWWFDPDTSTRKIAVNVDNIPTHQIFQGRVVVRTAGHNIIINDVKKSDRGLFTCVVEDESRDVLHVIKLNVVDYLTVEKSNKVALPCYQTMTGANPPSWLFQLPGSKSTEDVVMYGKLVNKYHNKATIEQPVTGEYELVIKDVEVSSSGYYECVENDNHHRVEVIVAISGEVGSNISLPCQPSAEETVEWVRYKDLSNSVDELIYSGGKIYKDFTDRFRIDTTIENEYNLVIHDASIQDNGVYVCKEKNGFGDWHCIQLNIKGNTIIRAETFTTEVHHESTGIDAWIVLLSLAGAGVVILGIIVFVIFIRRNTVGCENVFPRNTSNRAGGDRSEVQPLQTGDSQKEKSASTSSQGDSGIVENISTDSTPTTQSTKSSQLTLPSSTPPTSEGEDRSEAEMFITEDSQRNTGESTSTSSQGDRGIGEKQISTDSTATTQSTKSSQSTLLSSTPPTSDECESIMGRIKLNERLPYFLEPDVLVEHLTCLEKENQTIATTQNPTDLLSPAKELLNRIKSHPDTKTIVQQLLEALRKTGQTHVINVIDCKTDTEEVPLDETTFRVLFQNSILEGNLIFNLNIVVDQLVQEGCILERHKNYIIAGTMEMDKSRRMIQIMSRRSQSDYKKFVSCLRRNQNPLGQLLAQNGNGAHRVDIMDSSQSLSKRTGDTYRVLERLLRGEEEFEQNGDETTYETKKDK
jgi:hypothetical protein